MTDTPTGFQVLLTESAEKDLESIYDYITELDCPANANKLLDSLMEATDGLSQFPERGSYPKELITLGIKEYRQVILKPYRLIYRIIGKHVVIYLIMDGRRDMQSILTNRLLGA